jgi:hypothetical protein
MELCEKLSKAINKKTASQSIYSILLNSRNKSNYEELNKFAFVAPLIAEAGKFMLPLVASSIARKQLLKSAPRLAERSGVMGRIGRGLPNFLNRPIASAAAVDMPVMGFASVLGNPILDAGGRAFGYKPNKMEMQPYFEDSTAGVSKISSFKKQAFQNPGDMTSADFANIKKELASRGVSPVYDDFTGEQRRAYNENLLKARDAAVDDIPVISGGIAGLKGGLLGAGIGGAAGLAGGHLLRKAPFLNLSYKTRSALPAVLGGTSALLSGILSSMPAAKNKYEAVQALKKLQNTNNISDVSDMNTADQYLLHS